MKKLFILALTIFLFGVLFYLNKYDTPPKQQDLAFGTFVDIPSQIDGFACFIFNSKKDMSEKMYLGAGDDSYSFFLNINGQLTEFLKKNNNLISDRYELKIIQKESGVSEGEYYETLGTITVKDVTKNKEISRDFVGFCVW